MKLKLIINLICVLLLGSAVGLSGNCLFTKDDGIPSDSTPPVIEDK